MGEIILNGEKYIGNDISGKADKVQNATNGNFAGLDANGNLTDSGHKHDDYATKVQSATENNLAALDSNGKLKDSGWASAKTTTAANGNPISIPGLKSNQLVIDPIITFEPIQAGSGTSSPSNVRAISGYDKVEVLSLGINIWDEKHVSGWMNPDGTVSPGSTTQGFLNKNPIRVIPNTTYYFYSGADYSKIFYCICDKAGQPVSARTALTATRTIITPSNGYILNFMQADLGDTYNNDISINYPATDTSYHASNKTTDISESLGQTIYKGSLDLRTGKFTVTHKGINLGDLTYTYNGGGLGEFSASLSDSKAASTVCNPNAYCSVYEVTKYGYRDNNRGNYSIGVCDRSYGNGIITILDNRYTSASDLKTALSGQILVYELATPFTIQLTPHEISLLSQYAYVSTNGTSMSFSYHNGEMASLDDVAQVAETVNELGSITNTHKKMFQQITTITTSTSLAYTGLSVTIPAGKRFTIMGLLVYSNAKPLEIALAASSDSNLQPHQLYARAECSNISFSGYSYGQLTFYLHAKYVAAAANQVRIYGWYED